MSGTEELSDQSAPSSLLTEGEYCGAGGRAHNGTPHDALRERPLGRNDDSAPRCGFFEQQPKIEDMIGDTHGHKD